MIVSFLCMHELGAHYTYSEVPYDAWFRELVGTTVSTLTGWERNHYDRLVHFSYGLLLTYPIRELLVRTVRMPRRLSYVLPVVILMSTSTLYEFVEWGAAVVFGGELGQAYLGTQGDVWDAQKDELLAATGAAAAMALAAVYERLRGHDPVRAWCARIGLY
jgi:putative membrane protein